jgi:septal ring factor EnvC (AmiA/AmiB activator)
MVYRLLLCWGIALSILYGASIDHKIKRSEAKLAQTRSAYANMDRKLAKIAKRIAANQRRLRKLDQIIAKFDQEISMNAVLLKEGKKRLEVIEKELKKLNRERSEKEHKLIDMLAERYVVDEVIREKAIETPDNVIELELLQAIMQADSEQIKALQNSYIKTLKESEALHLEAKHIKDMMRQLQGRKKKAAAERERRSKLMAKLESEKRAYQARLEKLQKEESDLRKTLAKLNILKRGSLKREEVRPMSQAIVNGDKLKVRTIGKSYQRQAIGHYRGPKTISPVGKAKVIKNFGPYKDPIYGIKIFNESITLRPYKKHAKVKNVLNGRVVFVKDTPMLGKVVIIEHRNNLHTIYAKMDKIAPTIKEGKRVKKGYVIGRVEKELMFEVTQKNRHINPLELITLSR